MDRHTINRRRWLILGVLCLSMFLVVVDNTIVNVALPTLSRELGASTSQLQWIVDAYSLVFAGLLLAAGSFGDRIGRKRTLQVGLLLFAATSVLAAVAGSASELIWARAAMGIGAALVFPATLAILTNVFTVPAERAKAIGIWAGVSGLAVALGPLSGGWLLRHFWWGSVFFVNVPIVLAALVGGHVLLPDSRDPHAGRFDRVGFVTSIAGITALIYTVIEAPHRGWTDPLTIGGFVAAVVLLGTFVAWERRVAQPLLDVRVFADARFSAASAAVTVSFFALFGFIFLVTQYFQFVRGYDTFAAGVHTLPFAAAAMVTAPLSARLALRIGTKVVVASGLALMGVGFWIASLTEADSSYWGVLVPAMVLMAAGLGLVGAPATESIMGSLPPERAGVGSAVNDTTRELGGTLGVAVVGSVFSSVYGPRIVDGFSGSVGLPAPAVEAARDSMAAAVAVAAQAPEAGRSAVLDIARQAFMDGMSMGSRVAAVACVLGALIALRALPARAGTGPTLQQPGRPQAQRPDPVTV
ncbi:MAG: MFS transporter [Acidimicrobiales bacterium]|nr:MFS transporter [Acidimicrobiales bacterium]